MLLNDRAQVCLHVARLADPTGTGTGQCRDKPKAPRGLRRELQERLTVEQVAPQHRRERLAVVMGIALREPRDIETAELGTARKRAGKPSISLACGLIG